MMMNTNRKTSVKIFPSVIEFGPPRPLRSVSWISWLTATGMRATIPARMIRLIPFPSPYSSICSPSHMRKMHPLVSNTTPLNQ